MKNPKVAIITSTFNQEENLRKCLKSLKDKTNYKNYKMYFIDDSGTGEIAKKIKKEFPWVDVSENKSNLGFSKSNNILIKKSLKEYSPNYILLLNDDTEIVDKDWLGKMVEVGESDPKIGILGCKIIYPDGNLQWFYKNGKMHFLKTKENIEETKETFGNYEVTNVIGACLFIRRKVIDEIGFLDDKFSPAYGEETDFCLRAGKKGYKLFYLGGTKIVHLGGSSTKHVKDWIWQIKKRNSIRLEWLNHSFPNIIKYTIIHFGSAVFSKKPLMKLKMLFKAYGENIKNLDEIKEKREERNSWKNQK